MIKSTTYYKSLEAEICKTATEACDQLMTDMGAEIHDDLVQKISMMNLYLNQLDRYAILNADLEETLINMRAEFDHISWSLKRVSRQLMPAKNENESFATTVEQLCGNMAKTRTAHIKFQQHGFERPVLQSRQGHMYRIVQELLHNAFRHSYAWHVWVSLYWEPGCLAIEVEDDGTGVNNLDEVINQFRIKRNTLKMRCNLLGATLCYSRGEQGLLARVEIPAQ